MTEPQKLKRVKFRKSLMAGKTQTQAAIDSGASPRSAHVLGSRMAKEPEVRNALEAAYRRLEANEDYLARKIKDGADKAKPGPTQLAYLGKIEEGLGYSKKDAMPDQSNTFNILSIIQAHGLVGKDGQSIDPKGLVQP